MDIGNDLFKRKVLERKGMVGGCISLSAPRVNVKRLYAKLTQLHFFIVTLERSSGQSMYNQYVSIVLVHFYIYLSIPLSPLIAFLILLFHSRFSFTVFDIHSALDGISYLVELQKHLTRHLSLLQMNIWCQSLSLLLVRGSSEKDWGH